jgi:hypothetical protein
VHRYGPAVVSSVGANVSRTSWPALQSGVLTLPVHRLLRLLLDSQQAAVIDPATLKGPLGGWLGALPVNNSVIYPWKMAAAHFICSHRNSL